MGELKMDGEGRRRGEEEEEEEEGGKRRIIIDAMLSRQRQGNMMVRAVWL